MVEINGDYPLNQIERQQYIRFGLVQISNHLAQPVSAGLYRIDQIPAFLQPKLAHCISPLRVYTDCLIDEIIATYCPQAGRVLDLGCGKGDYSSFFDRAGCHGPYLGLDAVPNKLWHSLQKFPITLSCKFVQAKAETLPLRQNSAIFAISSCALEHFTDDKVAIERLNKFMQPGSYSIHLVPSSWSLFLYVYHGYRRYSPARLTELFGQANFEIVNLWGLGGLPSFLLHLIWITWLEAGMIWEVPIMGKNLPHLRRLLGKLKIGPQIRQGSKFTIFYNRLLKLCLKLDRYLPFFPSGYAILVRKLNDTCP